jgi:hypothetical protein
MVGQTALAAAISAATGIIFAMIANPRRRFGE